MIFCPAADNSLSACSGLLVIQYRKVNLKVANK
jgi:hypothetical protein